MSYNKNRKTTADGRFTVGQYASAGGNGDRYPYIVRAVSDSGKEMLVSHVSTSSLDYAQKNNLKIIEVMDSVDCYGGPMKEAIVGHAQETQPVKHLKYGWGRRGPRAFGGFSPGYSNTRNPSF